METEKLLNLFPFSANETVDGSSLELLESYLPNYQRGQELCQIYIDHGTYFFRGLDRAELFDQVLKTVYATAQGRHSGGFKLTIPYESPHTLATLFFVLAIGVYLSLLSNQV